MSPPTPQVIPSPYSPPSVDFVAVVRISDQATLVQKVEKLSKDELQKFQDALSQLLDRAAKLPAYPGWTDKVQVDGDIEANFGGVLYSLADSQALSIVVVGFRGQHYPERVARELLQELAAKVRATVSAERLCEAKPGSLTSELKGELREAIKRYSDPAKIDKVSRVHVKVDQVKDLMQDNVKKILETHATLEHLQNQSQSMAKSADVFLKSSTAVRRQHQWSNLKVKIAVGASISAVVLCTTLPLINALGLI